MIRPPRIPAMLVALAPLLATVACSGTTDPGANVRVILTASSQASGAPALSASDEDRDGAEVLRRLDAANVTFSSLMARNTDGELVDLGIDLPHTVDVIGLLKGDEVTLPAGALPAGDYDQLVVVMTELELVFVNGGEIAVTPPGGGWTSIVRVTPFTVVEGEELTIALNLRLGRAFREASGSFRFFPDFEGHHRDD